MKEELKNTALGSVAGGRLVETKDEGWLVVPDFCKAFPTKEEAEKFKADIRNRRGHGGHRGHHGPQGPMGEHAPDNEYVRD